MMNKALLEAWLRRAQEEVQSLVRLLQEKGPKHFARPLITACAAVWAVSRFWYQPSAASLRKTELDIGAAKATVKYADKYKDAKNRLDLFYASLPVTKDRGAWLTEIVREQLRAEGIIPQNYSAVDEREIQGYVLASLTVTCRASWKQTASWIARMERSRYILHVSNLTIAKDAQEIGLNQVSVTISTVLPKSSGGGPA